MFALLGIFFSQRAAYRDFQDVTGGEMLAGAAPYYGTFETRDGKYLEQIGTYNPLLAKDDEKRVVLDGDRAKHWLSVGAQPTDRVARFLDVAGIKERAARSNPNKGKPGEKAVERAEEELANATIKAPIHATVLTRDVEIGSPVSSILNLGANASLVMTLGDDRLGRAQLEAAAKLSALQERAVRVQVELAERPFESVADRVARPALTHGSGHQLASMRAKERSRADTIEGWTGHSIPIAGSSQRRPR